MEIHLLKSEMAVALLMGWLLLVDLFMPRIPKRYLARTAVVFLLGITGWLVWTGAGVGERWMEGVLVGGGGMFVLDGLALWGKEFAFWAALFAMVAGMRFAGKDDDHLVERVFLQLAACLGMMLLASASHFALVFVALELVTVVFYVLVASRRHDGLSVEAGVKYLIYGAMSSGVMLYGMALVYGATGSLGFAETARVAAQPTPPMLLKMGLLLMLAGLGFKLAAAPFHWWAPDVYEGAPTPVTAFLATLSKGAGFVLLVRMLTVAFGGMKEFWLPVIGVMAGLSLLFGSLGGISQTSLKRLMGYSSVAHTGFMLLGVAAVSCAGLGGVLYYLTGYLLANALVFGVMCETSGENPYQEIREYAGLGARSRWLAGALLIGLLSLSGIPPLAGFVAKLLMFKAAWQGGMTVLLGIALLAAVVSLYYYLNVIRHMYAGEPVLTDGLRVPYGVKLLQGALAAGVVAVGFFPGPWWDGSLMIVRALAGR
ncbi:MAG: NADH-quinone oxidoreductase subunit N [Verrucomicrobiae bacterium]|nr:NADH-quinone oxidoreductase subunit N [Verrucomicrobiae bacterium]